MSIFELSVLLCLFIFLNGQEAIAIDSKCTARKTASHFKYKTNSVASVTGRPAKITGKWPAGRISRNPYEIDMNRKTKSFIDTKRTSAYNNIKKYRGLIGNKAPYSTLAPQESAQKSVQDINPQSNDRSYIPSYIEFDYLDLDFDEKIKRKDSISRNSRTGLIRDVNKLDLLQPLFLFTAKAPCYTALNCKTSLYSNKNFPFHKIREFTNQKGKLTENKSIQNKYTAKSVNKTNMKTKPDIRGNKKTSSSLKERFITLVPRSPNDRIKFFEIYDSDTHKPHIFGSVLNNDTMNNIMDFDQIHHNIDNHGVVNKTRHVKKYASYNVNDNNSRYVNHQAETTKYNNSTVLKVMGKILTKHSQPALWTDFPFVAVYVYEPMQVRCDSAAISPHWLVASATCLYRHHKDLNTKTMNTEGRSAFVTYCGSNWRLPERIAYVKRSFIHPQFQAKHKSRRYLYNIGAIQVLNSMANTCHGWRPVSLMSHQFVADRSGSYAAAVGWGLDRYESQSHAQLISDVPTHPLMLYEGIVYSSACPGNTDYSKVMMLNEESIKNVYCLSLPTSNIGDNDTIHGGLLLIGGKLIALYLKEESKPWGVQSALYTGVWHLIPWLLDVAREGEELDTFVLDM